MFGGDRFPYHGHFVPGSANGIGFEDLVVIEDYEFCRSVADGREHEPGFADAVDWVSVQAALLRSARVGTLGGRRIAAGGLMETTTTATLRIGVIGVGRIGRMHAELLARQVPGAAVTCVHDELDGERARTVAESLGAVAAADLDELLDAPDVDAVAICSSTDTHADLIVAAAEAGKAIFCEKPVSLDLAAVDRALAAVEAAGVPFQIGFNRRFDPAHEAVAAAVAGGRDRRAAARADHEPRPGAAAARATSAAPAASSWT